MTAHARGMLHEGADAVWPHGDFVTDCWVCRCIAAVRADATRAAEAEVAGLRDLLADAFQCIYLGTDYGAVTYERIRAALAAQPAAPDGRTHFVGDGCPGGHIDPAFDAAHDEVHKR